MFLLLLLPPGLPPDLDCEPQRLHRTNITDTARILCNGPASVRLSVCQSVCPIDRKLHWWPAVLSSNGVVARRSAANAGSVMLTAEERG